MAVLLKMSEVSERLNCSLQHAYALVSRKDLPAIRIGVGGRGGIRVDDADLQHFVESRRRIDTPPWPEKAKPVQLKHIRL
jgi:excisionase family DNA binding protein